jgi:chromosome segregation ATPase
MIDAYKKRIDELEQALIDKTKEYDSIERLRGVGMHTINVLEAKVEEKKNELAEAKAETLRLREAIINLNEQFNICASGSKMERVIKTFSANVEDHVAKRARVAD